tara:strand:- start:602 stop:901 length:300 start_codon:yes stop_codon:yes gene_type:complete
MASIVFYSETLPASSLMIVIVNNSQLKYNFGFNELEGDTIQNLIDLFVEKYQKKTYDEASLILVKGGALYYIIKNIYGSLSASVFEHSLPTIISSHLEI